MLAIVDNAINARLIIALPWNVWVLVNFQIRLYWVFSTEK